jgi:hypothetical protein
MAKKFGLDAALLDNPTKEGIDNAKSTLAGAVAATDAGTTKA